MFLKTAAAALAAATAMTLAVPAGAARIRPPGPASPLCAQDQLYRVVNYLDEYVTMRDDIFGQGHVCLDVKTRSWSWFKIASTARAPQGSIGAYPEIFYGCVYGKCTEDTVLPERVPATTGMVSTWRTFATRPTGLWNKAYDIWFSRHREIGGQAAGAELMVWLDAKFPIPPPTRPIVKIAGRRYWFFWHRACNRTVHLCWNFLVFRRVHPVDGVLRLPLTPFIAFAEHYNLISDRWWMESVEAGFELWRGGVGLGTSRFGVIP